MKKFLLFALFACCFISPAKADEDPCEEYAQFYYAISVNRNILKFDLSNNGTTDPQQKELIGTWSEQYHVNINVASITFNEDGTLNYVNKPDTTWDVVNHWGGEYATMKYSVKNQKIAFFGSYYSIPFAFSSGYSIKDNMLTIDSFAYDGGVNHAQFKQLILYKQ